MDELFKVISKRVDKVQGTITHEIRTKKVDVPNNSNGNENIVLKILFVGGFDVKSCFIHSYVNGEFTDSYQPIGVNYLVKGIVSRGKNASLQLWDTNSQERFDQITNAYYRLSSGIIVGYDITDRKSFENTRCYFDYAFKYSNNPFFMVIGYKADLANEKREVSVEEGEKLAKEYGASLFFEGKC